VTAPLIPACRLWKKQSAAGQSYLVGRMGGLRVLIMANKERSGDEDHTHILLITAAPDTGAAQTTEREVSPNAPPDARPAWAKAKARGKRSAVGGQRSQIPNDPVPF
jgi:hypothetical protein